MLYILLSAWIHSVHSCMMELQNQVLNRTTINLGRTCTHIPDYEELSIFKLQDDSNRQWGKQQLLLEMIPLGGDIIPSPKTMSSQIFRVSRVISSRERKTSLNTMQYPISPSLKICLDFKKCISKHIHQLTQYLQFPYRNEMLVTSRKTKRCTMLSQIFISL